MRYLILAAVSCTSLPAFAVPLPFTPLSCLESSDCIFWDEQNHSIQEIYDKSIEALQDDDAGQWIFRRVGVLANNKKDIYVTETNLEIVTYLEGIVSQASRDTLTVWSEAFMFLPDPFTEHGYLLLFHEQNIAEHQEKLLCTVSTSDSKTHNQSLSPT